MSIYSLLAGINLYHPDGKVPSLYGCRNDILTWQSFLEDRFPKERLNSTILLDGDATYRNVVHHFGEAFLGRAKKGDTVLFAYSGHGSREGAAPEFGRYYPEKQQETLVLYDSRTPDGLDLADKELAVLIERIAVKGVNVVVVLDCCHAGSGTRVMEDFTLGEARQHPARNGEYRRSLDNYLEGAFRYRNGGQGFYLPASRHILLAACDRKEKAYELSTKSGLFSSSLHEILQETGGQLSYADLFTRCRIAMTRTTDKQHPQFEPYGFFNGYDGFLGLCGSSSGAPLRVFFDNDTHTWNASMGAVHGLPTDGSNPVQMEVFQEGKVLCLAESKLVGMEATTLEEPGFPLDIERDYEARLQSMAVPRMIVGLSGNESLIKMVLEKLEDFKPRYFDLQANIFLATYLMEVDETKIQLFRHADGMCLRTIEGNDWERMIQDTFVKLELIARWEMTVQLDNHNSKINHGDVELVLYELDSQGEVLRETSENEAVIDILRLNKKEEQKVPYRLEVCNQNREKLRHCALFYASGNYDFKPVGFNEPVPAGSNAIAMERNGKGVRYAFMLNEKNEAIDIFKLFVSNVKLNGEALQQKGFQLGETVNFWQDMGMRGEVQPLPSRDLANWGEDDEKEDANDWYTITLRVKCVAREAKVGEEALSLAGNFIKVLPHPFFKAGVGLGNTGSGGRSLEPMGTVAALAKYVNAELLTFGESTGNIDPLNMLELSGIENEESLKDCPLQLEIAAKLQQTDELEETLLPLTFDGEHLLPVGLSERMDDGTALVSISHLPATVDVHRRSLGKALKLCFLKLVLKKKKNCDLRWVDYSLWKPVRCSENLKNKVAAAGNILLLVHGLYGDTKSMLECMRPFVKTTEDGNPPFDLVLTFDYENLNTPIEETAGHLETMLREEAGITDGNGQQLTLLGHSMGGLVARYFIENLNGKRLVRHLLMTGTPNAGSAMAKITTYRDYAIPLLTLLVNVPWGILAAATVLGVLEKSKDLTVTLAQMDWENNNFLKNLNKSESPGVRYSILAGNLDHYLENNTRQKKLMDKVDKLGGKLFYGEIPNDLAVSMESIKAVPGSYTPAPVVAEVACYHMGYFEERVSMEEIIRLLSEPV